MNLLKIDSWYQILSKNSEQIKNKPPIWQYCGETKDGYLFQRFNVDFFIPFAEADLFTFYREPPSV